MRNGTQEQKIIILGATSAMAEAASRIWAEEGAHFLLAGRNAARLEEIACDLRVRGAQVETMSPTLLARKRCNPFVKCWTA